MQKLHVLERYTLERRLAGDGKSGGVWLATDTLHGNRQVVLKRYNAEHKMIEDALYHFPGDRSKAAAHIGWTPAVAEKMQLWKAEERFRRDGEGWGRAALAR